MENGISGLLVQNSIFEGLSEEQIAEILPCAAREEKTFRENECVYEKGDHVRELGVVLRGGLRAIGDGGEAMEIPPNGMFGELVVFSTGGALRQRIVAAKEGTTVLFLSPDFFRSSCGKDKDCLAAHGEVMANMLRLLSDKAISLGKKVAYLTAPDLRTKIAMYLCELYETTGSATFTMPLNRDQLADFFSVARPSLSRELVHMKEQGLIDFRRSSVTILDGEGLYRVAESRNEDLGGSAPNPPQPFEKG
jgi:CRP-like cAMP-binding protein